MMHKEGIFRFLRSFSCWGFTPLVSAAMPTKINKSRRVEWVLMKARPKPVASPPPTQPRKKRVSWVEIGCQKYKREGESSEVASAVSTSEERKQKARVDRFDRSTSSGQASIRSDGATAAAPASARHLSPRRGKTTPKVDYSAVPPPAEHCDDLVAARAKAERELLARQNARAAEDLVVSKKYCCLFCLLFCVIN